MKKKQVEKIAFELFIEKKTIKPLSVKAPILEKSNVNIHEKRTKNSITSDLFTRFFSILKKNSEKQDKNRNVLIMYCF